MLRFQSPLSHNPGYRVLPKEPFKALNKQTKKGKARQETETNLKSQLQNIRYPSPLKPALKTVSFQELVT